MVAEIGYGTRAQFIAYWNKATVNVGSSRSISSARVANNHLASEAPAVGQIHLKGLQGNALVTLSINTAYEILAVLERLETNTQKALDDGTTLAGDTSEPTYYVWRNTEVTTGNSKITPTSYEYGDRTASITVTASIGLLDGGIPSNAVDGEYGNDITNGWYTNSIDNTDHWIQFDFGAGNSRIVDEVTWQFLGSQTEGTWKWQGSHDGYTFYDLGNSFTMGGEGTQVQDSLGDNTTGYRYYRLLGVGGTTSTQLQQEVFFKVIDATPAPSTVAQVQTANRLNFIHDEVRQGVAAIDNLVAAAESSGANIISSTSRPVILRFTQYGGSLTVSPQSLDSLALGITDIGALTEEEARDALSAIQNAISSTRAKLTELHNIQNGMNFAKGSMSGSVVSGATFLPAGSLVDVIA